jgi:hypothetical protein
LGITEEQKEEDMVAEDTGKNELQISTRGQKESLKANKIEFLDVYQIVANTVLSSFENIKESDSFCWFHISLSVSQNAKITNLHFGEKDDFFFLSKKYVDDKGHPALPFSESLQICSKQRFNGDD